MYSGYVYNKDGKQINWLDSWENKDSMIICAKEQKTAHLIKIYKTPDYFASFKTSDSATQSDKSESLIKDKRDSNESPNSSYEELLLSP